MVYFSVTRLPSNTYAYENILAHNRIDFSGQDEIYFQFKDTLFKSLSGNIPEKCIGFGATQRIFYSLQLNEKVDISPYKISNKIIKKLEIFINPKKSTLKLITINEIEFIDWFKGKMTNHYFYNNQVLIILYLKNLFVVEINTHSDNQNQILDEGFISSSTAINVVSQSESLNFISNKVLNRDLFKNDYNFEKLGIGGLNEELFGIFRRALSSRAVKPSIVKKLGIRHVKGILLYGPPGTGKTLIAKKIGNLLTNKPAKIIKGPEVLSKFVGGSEENVRNIFLEAQLDYDLNKENAELHIVIFDEIDAICKARSNTGGTHSNVTDSIVNQLLSIIDGPQSLENIFMIAMTNRKDLLDEALIRAGRIEVHIEIKLPDLEGRKQIYRIHTNSMKINQMMSEDVDVDELAIISENFSGAEIESVVKNASSYALHEILNTDYDNYNFNEDEDVVVTKTHFMKAIKDIVPLFGNFNQNIQKLLPIKFILPTDSHVFAFNELKHFVKNKNRLKTVLLYGSTGTGKTTMVSQIAFESKINFVKIIRPIDVIRFNEQGKSEYLINSAYDAYLSKNSLLIFDDIEILINYTEMNGSVSFSNKLYQIVQTIFKTYPTNQKYKLTIIVTCGDIFLMNQIKKTFDKVLKLENIERNNVSNVIKDLDIKNDTNYDITENTYSIKQLINLC